MIMTRLMNKKGIKGIIYLYKQYMYVGAIDGVDIETISW